jgi:histone deacetylase 6
MKTDVTKKYIDEAIDNGFQVIDVNIPKTVSIEDVRDLVTYWKQLTDLC